MTKEVNVFARLVDEVAVHTTAIERPKLADSHPTMVDALEDRFKSAILSLSEACKAVPTKHYIRIKNATKTIACIEKNKLSLKIVINVNRGELSDPRNLARDVSRVGHLGIGSYQIKVLDDRDLEYILSLIKQSF